MASRSANFGDARLGRLHVHALAALVEVHLAVGEREQAVVLGPADEPAGGVAGAALRHQDAAGGDALAAVLLDAAALRQRIPAVLDRALSLLVCHVWRS